ncbi:hypothetical protein HQ585_14760 [candidate division KSB1 bacterium]|nr:hypothetical protein [candidate division KSB1 bacterium]
MKRSNKLFLLICTLVCLGVLLHFMGCSFKNPADNLKLRLNAEVNKTILDGPLTGNTEQVDLLEGEGEVHVTAKPSRIGKAMVEDTSFMEVNLGLVDIELVERYRPIIYEDHPDSNLTIVHVIAGSATNNKKNEVELGMYYADSSGILDIKDEVDEGDANIIKVFGLLFDPEETLNIDEDTDFDEVADIHELDAFFDELLADAQTVSIGEPPTYLYVYFTAEGDSVDMTIHEMTLNLDAVAKHQTVITPEDYAKYDLNKLENPGLSGMIENLGAEDVVIKVFFGTSGVPYDEPSTNEERIALMTAAVGGPDLNLTAYPTLYLEADGETTIQAGFANLTSDEPPPEEAKTWYVDIIAKSAANISVLFHEVAFDGLAELEVDTD